MSTEKERQRALDDFWNLTELAPKSSRKFGRPSSVDATEISLDPPARSHEQSTSQGQDTVIKRYIPSRSAQSVEMPTAFDGIEVYSPTGSLLHKVTLKKLKCSYHYYGEFLADAIRYMDVEGEEAPFEPYFSYVPQYNQLSREQLAFYFWFRQNARREHLIEVDQSYVFLYVFELINLGARLDVRKTQQQLVWLWKSYHKTYPSLATKLADWICDFSLIHRLPAPEEATAELVRSVVSLKEFYIPMPEGDMVDCTRSLLRYCTSYDYRTSKFATEEHLPLFEKHVFGALLCAVRRFSVNGSFLSEVALEDSRVTRDAFAGALCVADQKYRIEVEYCSFSRSNELRFLVGDLVKYCENKLRAHLGVKSRMTVYSLSTEMRAVLDSYFSEALPRGAVKRKAEPQAYEALYDVPAKPLSLSLAARIEEESWETTRELTEAFEEPVTKIEEVSPISAEKAPAPIHASDSPDFGVWDPLLRRLLAGESHVIEAEARALGKLPDTLAESINEIAFELIGDAILEEENGFYQMIEDYRSLWEETE